MSNNQDKPYLLIIGAIFLLVIAPLFFLIIKKSQSASPPVKQDESVNLYEILDKKLDSFLLQKNTSSLDEAKKIAQSLKDINQDSYGLDLLAYYSSTLPNNYDSLFYLRTRFKELSNKSPSIENESYLEEANRIYEGFLSLNAKIETKRTQILIVKFYAVNGDIKANELSNSLLREAAKENHLYLKCNFLVWQNKFNYDRQGLIETSKLALKLNLMQIYFSSISTLAGLYELSGENERAIELAEEALKKKVESPITRIALLEILSISFIKTNQIDKAIKTVEESLLISQQVEHNYCIALSHIIRGLIYAKTLSLTESESSYDQALAATNSIENESLKQEILTMCNAYKARNYLSEGKKSLSVIFYKNALNIYSKVQIKNNWVLSELNEGIANSLNNDNGSNYYQEASNYYLLQAQINKDKRYSSIFRYN